MPKFHSLGKNAKTSHRKNVKISENYENFIWVLKSSDKKNAKISDTKIAKFPICKMLSFGYKNANFQISLEAVDTWFSLNVSKTVNACCNHSSSYIAYAMTSFVWNCHDTFLSDLLNLNTLEWVCVYCNILQPGWGGGDEGE